jgi:Uma2 family endonuclease
MVDQLKITAAEFLAMPETPETIELINGELSVSPTPVDLHQYTVVELIFVFRKISPDRGRVRTAPLDVHFDDENVVQPDVFWISKPESRCKLGEDGYWHGAPDLVVEVLSPSTAIKDRGRKYTLYERYGVREYWIVDTDGRYIEVYQHNGTEFKRLGVFGVDETFKSIVLDVEINVMEIFPA